MSEEPKIAVLDEDRTKRSIIIERLARRGLLAFGVTSEEELRAPLSRGAETTRRPGPPELILLVPRQPGSLAAAIHRLRSGDDTSQLPIIVLGEQDQLKQALALGAADFVHHRASGVELCARVRARLPAALAMAEEPSPSSRLTLEHYAEFFDASPDGVLVINPHGKVLFCNRVACEITGRTSEQLVSQQLTEMLARDGRTRLAQLQESFAAGEYPTSVDLPIRTPKKQRRVLNVSFNPLLHEQRGIIISLRDVTGDRALARELTRTKEFLQRVIDSSADAIVSADMKGKVLLFNPAAERTYGYRAATVIGKMHVAELYPEGIARKLMRRIRSPEHGGEGKLEGFRTELLGKDGSAIPVQLSAALIIHRKRAIGSVGVFRDLRAKLQIEARLREAQEELAIQEKKSLIAELAGAAAHELNQPLTAVMGYAELLALKLDETPRHQRAAKAIMTETSRMAEIVRKIGRLTKYETKDYVGDAKIIDLDRAVDSDPNAVVR